MPARPLYNLCSRRALFLSGCIRARAAGLIWGTVCPAELWKEVCSHDALWSGDKAGAGMEWAGVVAKVMDYYARADPVCGELLRLRYLERWREDKTFPALHIGRTTYYTKELEALSTVGIYAAAAGLLDDVRDFGPVPDSGRRG